MPRQPHTPPKKRKLRLPAHDAFPHHVDSGVSLTTINVLVTCNATYRYGLCDNNCGLRNFKRTVSTGHTHSTLNEFGFVKQTVSTTNLVSSYIRQSISGLPLSFLSFLSLMRELCYIHRRTGRGGEGGCSPPPNFGQLRFFGQREKIWAKPVFKDVSMFI